MSTPSDTDGLEAFVMTNVTAVGGPLTPELVERAGAAAITPSRPQEGTEGNAGSTDQAAEEGTKPVRLFGSLTPQEAGRRSAQARREREQSSETAEVQARADEVRLVRTTVATGSIIQRLSADAAKGNVQAARELRGWLSELPIETDTDLSSLDKRTRQALLAKLLREIEVEGEAQQAGMEEEAVSTSDATADEEAGQTEGHPPGSRDS